MKKWNEEWRGWPSPQHEYHDPLAITCRWSPRVTSRRWRMNETSCGTSWRGLKSKNSRWSRTDLTDLTAHPQKVPRKKWTGTSVPGPKKLAEAVEWFEPGASLCSNWAHPEGGLPEQRVGAWVVLELEDGSGRYPRNIKFCRQQDKYRVHTNITPSRKNKDRCMKSY